MAKNTFEIEWCKFQCDFSTIRGVIWSHIFVSRTGSALFGIPKSAKIARVPDFGYQKMRLWGTKIENGDHFFTPTSTQNGGIFVL